MALDPKKHADWEIAQDAETRMKTVYQIGRDLGLLESELLPYGHVMGKVDYRSVLGRLDNRPNGKYIDVTAITPTPLGEGNVHHDHRSRAGTRTTWQAFLRRPSASLLAVQPWA